MRACDLLFVILVNIASGGGNNLEGAVVLVRGHRSRKRLALPGSSNTLIIAIVCNTSASLIGLSCGGALFFFLSRGAARFPPPSRRCRRQYPSIRSKEACGRSGRRAKRGGEKKNLFGMGCLLERILTLEDDRNNQKNPSQQLKKLQVGKIENPLFLSLKIEKKKKVKKVFLSSKTL
jgi:hypothetical protein